MALRHGDRAPWLQLQIAWPSGTATERRGYSCRGSRVGCDVYDSAGTPATTNESAYPFFRLAQYDHATNPITRHRVLLRAVRRHR
jgi:hypothetical protein